MIFEQLKEGELPSDISNPDYYVGEDNFLYDGKTGLKVESDELSKRGALGDYASYAEKRIFHVETLITVLNNAFPNGLEKKKGGQWPYKSWNKKINQLKKGKTVEFRIKGNSGNDASNW